jgi:hypothetical protein
MTDTGLRTRAMGVLILRLAVALYLLAQLARTYADPDLWGHVRFGLDTLAHGLPQYDSYSFGSDVRWINHEWLAEIAMALAWRGAGNAGLIALKLATIVVTGGCVVAALRARGVALPERDLLLAGAILPLWPRLFVLRPQVFSLALFALLLLVLAAAERGRRRWLWMIVPLFAAWANLHGGWLVGAAVLGLWAASSAAAFGAAALPWGTALMLTAGALAATLLNPYGVEMWRFLWETVGLSRPDIADWRPLADMGLTGIVLWLIPAGVALAAAVRRGRALPLGHAAIVLALAVGSLRVNRLDAFFALASVMLLGPHAVASAGRGRTRALEPVPARARIAAAVACVAVLASALLWAQRSRFDCVRLDGPWMPEREAGAFIEAHALSGRLLTWFGWGQYLIWHDASRLRVSFDGRRETVYSASYIAHHTQLYFTPEAEEAFLASLRADYAWLPVALPLTASLERSGWQPLYRGSISTILARPSRPAPRGIVPVTGPPCFPGP